MYTEEVRHEMPSETVEHPSTRHSAKQVERGEINELPGSEAEVK